MWRFPIAPLLGDSSTSDLSIIVGYPQANWVGQWTNLRPTSEKNQCKILASSRYLGGLPPSPRFTSKGLRLACIDDIGITITDWLECQIHTLISTTRTYADTLIVGVNVVLRSFRVFRVQKTDSYTDIFR